MISPTEVAKRVGVGGRLAAFAKAVCVYFALAPTAPAAPSAVAAVAKVAPILCLMLLVLLPRATTLSEQGSLYARRVGWGLALSALGDTFLVWPSFFEAGMGAFAAAHFCYIAAFGWHSLKPGLGAAVFAPAALFVTVLQPAGVMRYLVPCYALVLATMVWRALALASTSTSSTSSTRAARAAAVGAVLFMLSDSMLGYSLFGGTVPYERVATAVMSTYYMGQLGIALSALEPPVPTPAPHRA